ncbi:hypothetical protein Dxin01_03389 [Deinococcus xinjiangensis]|uniref:Lipoprotein n=1 Tax=Deinococcus xinjiangensis TaxID=457454 RepID=A0ABP9VH81_9DEIO
MKKRLTCLILSLACGSLACPAKSGLFNGAINGTIQGFQPYCSADGRKLQRDFINGHRKVGATVNYSEGYKFYATDDVSIANALRSLEKLLGSISYEYVTEAQGDYTTQYVFRKNGTLTRGMLISLEVTQDYALFFFTNGEFPFLKDE